MLEKYFGLRELARPYIAAGQTAGGRGDDLPAVFPKQFQVILSHRVFKHPGVHGGGDKLGAPAGQNRGSKHIICQTVGQFGTYVGGGRGHQNQIGAVGKGDVLYLMREIAVKRVHHSTIPGEPAQR